MGSLQFQLQVHLGRPKSLLENSIKEGWLVAYKNLTVNPLNINVLLKQTLSKPFISIKANTQPFIWYLISSYHFLNDLYPFSVIFEGSTSFLTTWESQYRPTYCVITKTTKYYRQYRVFKLANRCWSG